MHCQTLIQIVSALALTSTLVGAAPSNNPSPQPNHVEVGRIRQAFRGLGNITVEWVDIGNGDRKAHIDKVQISPRALTNLDQRSINVDPSNFLSKYWKHGVKKTIAGYNGWQTCVEGGSQIVPQFLKDTLPSVCEHFLNEIPGKQTLNAGWDLYQKSGIRVNPTKKNDKNGGEPGILNWGLGRVDSSAATFDKKLCDGLIDSIMAPQCLWDGDTAGVVASAAGWAMMADPDRAQGD
ncbi:uncharacterized protein F4822DRAFT_426390 [Hypoxylon trugodes]|uniref:uncharacterized protein n=1 Tax=Hypoxylon trugodes TaxID=326681 RepID=UPI0021958BD1|nr:uncharacterized protein F4822DRAFT_426390 [Hypoxylon trugodes]KAI1390544.1 hypothetical protein F4822DRAFT_426390 [Hypoxylon trugodes]